MSIVHCSATQADYGVDLSWGTAQVLWKKSENFSICVCPFLNTPILVSPWLWKHFMILWPDLNQPIFKEKSLANNWIITSHSFHATWQMVGWENKETRIAKVFLRRRHHSLQAKFMPRQNLDICKIQNFTTNSPFFSFRPLTTPLSPQCSYSACQEREREKWRSGCKLEIATRAFPKSTVAVARNARGQGQ